MKNLLTILLVLAMASAASASAVWLEVDPQDAKDSYMPSDVITINVVADFVVGGLTTNIGADGGTAQAVGTLHPNLKTALFYEGDLINAGGVLISNISGGAMVGQPGVPISAVLYSFEFHVPQVDESTIITIDDITDFTTQPPMSTGVSSTDYMTYLTDIGALEIHVPEPMTIALLGLGGLFLRRRR